MVLLCPTAVNKKFGKIGIVTRKAMCYDTFIYVEIEGVEEVFHSSQVEKAEVGFGEKEEFY